MCPCWASRQGSRTPHFHVSRCDGKTTAQIRVFLQCAQPHHGGLGQGGIARNEQVVSCPYMASAHPASKLVESWAIPSSSARLMIMVLTLGISMPDSMMVEHTSTWCSLRMKPNQNPLQVLFVHLAMGNCNVHFGQQGRNRVAIASMLATRLCTKNTLSALTEFGHDVLSYPRLIEPGHVGLNGPPIFGWGRDQAHLCETRQRHVERSRELGLHSWPDSERVPWAGWK